MVFLSLHRRTWRKHYDLDRHRDDRSLQTPLLTKVFPSDSYRLHVVDDVAAFLSEAPKSLYFHRSSREMMATHVEGHLSRTTVMVALARHGYRGSRLISINAT